MELAALVRPFPRREAARGALRRLAVRYDVEYPGDPCPGDPLGDVEWIDRVVTWCGGSMPGVADAVKTLVAAVWVEELEFGWGPRLVLGRGPVEATWPKLN